MAIRHVSRRIPRLEVLLLVIGSRIYTKLLKQLNSRLISSWPMGSELWNFVVWNLDQKGFSVISMHIALKIRSIGYPFKSLWKFKIPAKIKVFLWLAARNIILTNDVLHQRGWIGDWMCQFCGANETNTHLFFLTRLLVMFGMLLVVSLALRENRRRCNICWGVGCENSLRKKNILLLFVYSDHLGNPKDA